MAVLKGFYKHFLITNVNMENSTPSPAFVISVLYLHCISVHDDITFPVDLQQ